MTTSKIFQSEVCTTKFTHTQDYSEHTESNQFFFHLLYKMPIASTEHFASLQELNTEKRNYYFACKSCNEKQMEDVPHHWGTGNWSYHACLPHAMFVLKAGGWFSSKQMIYITKLVHQFTKKCAWWQYFNSSHIYSLKKKTQRKSLVSTQKPTSLNRFIQNH